MKTAKQLLPRETPPATLKSILVPVDFSACSMKGLAYAKSLAKEFGATDVVSERGEEAVEHVRKLTGGFGVHSVLECVGTEQAMATCVGITRPGGAIGRVGVPHYEAIPHAGPLFYNNIVVGGGPAPVRGYIDELLPDVLEGRIEPGRVFDRTIGINEVPNGYREMDERKAIKVMVKP